MSSEFDVRRDPGGNRSNGDLVSAAAADRATGPGGPARTSLLGQQVRILLLAGPTCLFPDPVADHVGEDDADQQAGDQYTRGHGHHGAQPFGTLQDEPAQIQHQPQGQEQETDPLLRQQLGMGRQCVGLSDSGALFTDVLPQLDDRLRVVGM